VTGAEVQSVLALFAAGASSASLAAGFALLFRDILFETPQQRRFRRRRDPPRH